MSKYEQSHRQRSYRDHQNSTREYSPSFSSSLLDAIYRSFDESSIDQHLRKTNHESAQKEESVFFEQSTEKTRSCGRESKSSSRAQLIHRWIKKTAEKDILLRISTADHHSHEASKTSLKTDRGFEAQKLMNSSSSSSDSSAVFSSSSESSSEPFHGSLKPIRTRLNHQQEPQIRQLSDPRNHRDQSTVATVTKSKSMSNIDGNLKKSRQNPISPGAKLASFINSLFAAKKPKISSPPIKEAIKSEKDLKSPANSSSSTCSTASSLSRSCLNTTPSSAGRHEQQTGKRSVRFCPVTEDSKRGSHEKRMAVYVDDEFRVRIMEEGRRRIEEAAMELLEKYRHQDDDDDEDEDEDDRSCCSSDLFELENLTEIRIERYREELPVYGTTRLDVGNGIVV